MAQLPVLSLLIILAQDPASTTPPHPPLGPMDHASVENEWYLETDDGHCELFVWEVGSGDPLVVVHGGFGAEHSYLYDALRSVASDRRLVFYDQRGSLRSPCSPAHIDFAKHITDLDAVREALGVDRIDVFAHSMGTVIAMQYLQDHPQRVGRLVLAGALPADTSFRARGKEALDAFMDRTEIQAEQDAVRASGVTGTKLATQLWRIRYAGSSLYHVDRWRRMKGGKVYYNQAAGTAAGEALPRWDFTDALEAHAPGVAVINGDHDFADFDGEFYRPFAAATDNMELHLLRHAGHNSWIDAPTEFAVALRQALGAGSQPR